MAVIGLSKPYVALYSATSGTPTYSEGKLMAKAVEMNVKIETASANNDYADNEVSETDTTFAGGTLELTADDLQQDAAAMILGIVETAVAGMTDVTELIYDDDSNPPYLGFGAIVMKKKASQFRYRAIVLPKIQFSMPEDAATTKGSSIEWQHPELEATIFRDDSEKHRWKREATFNTEIEAEDYIKTLLNIGGQNEQLH